MSIYLIPTDIGDYATFVGTANIGDTGRGEKASSPFTGANNVNIDPGGVDFTFDTDGTDPSGVVIDGQGVANRRGFYLHSGETAATVIDGFTITNMTKGGYGFYMNSGIATVRNFVISNGIGATNGGAIIVYVTGTTFTNGLIYNNSVTGDGAATRIHNGPTVIFNSCTFAANIAGSDGTGDGGGLFAQTNATIICNDCIIWGNTAGTNGNEIRLDAATSVITLDYCCYGNGAGDVSNNGGTFTPTNCITSDPLHVAGDNGNYYLSQIAAGEGSDSPCLDAGSDTAANLGMDAYTTRSDNVFDDGQVDIGYHYGDGVAAGGAWGPFGNVNALGGGVR